jgi:hypothetical protein
MVKLTNYTTCLNNLSKNPSVRSESLTVLDKIKISDQPDVDYWYDIFLKSSVHDIFELLRYIMLTHDFSEQQFASILGIKKHQLYLMLTGSVKTLNRDKYKPKLTGLIPKWILEIYFDDNERFKC